MRLLATLALSAASVLSAAAAASADTIRVPGDHATIQAAVDAAGSGDTIRIGKGRFAEDVAISGKSDLRIVGLGRKSVITGSGVAFRIHASDGITLENVLIELADEAGVWASDSAGVTIRRCVVRNVESYGIFTERCDRVLVDRCAVDDVGDDGISLSGPESAGLTSDSTVSKCRVTRCDDLGIVVRGNRNLVEGCFVRDTGNDGVQTEATGGDCETKILKTRVQNTRDEGFEIDGQGTTLDRCTSRDAASDGFDVETDDCLLVKCIARGADDDGFELLSEDCRLEKCKSWFARSDGFEIGGPGHEVEKCTSVKSGEDGFLLTDSAGGATLIRNRATRSGGYDLDDRTPPGSCTLQGNVFHTTNP